MRLTELLLKYRPEFVGVTPKFPGKVTIGKHRYVPKITRFKKYLLWEELKYEEEVMKYISVPFLTEKQENAYLKSIGRTHPEYWDEFTRKNIVVPLKQVYGADFIKGLDVSRKFEEED